MAITYKGITKDALEIGGIFLDDRNYFDLKKMEQWREQFLPTEYKLKPKYDLKEDSFRGFI